MNYLSKDAMVNVPVVTIMGHVDMVNNRFLIPFVTHMRLGSWWYHTAYWCLPNWKRVVRKYLHDTPWTRGFTSIVAVVLLFTDITILIGNCGWWCYATNSEAINHSRLLVIPIIVAINKIDKRVPANVLSVNWLTWSVSTAWGGDN